MPAEGKLTDLLVCDLRLWPRSIAIPRRAAESEALHPSWQITSSIRKAQRLFFGGLQLALGG